MRNHLFLSLTAIGVAAVAFFCAPERSEADANDYVLDAGHSWVTFRLEHAGLVNAWGRFDGVEGKGSFDPTKPGESRWSAKIDASSVSTGNEKRDKHLRSPDFFNAAEHPHIVFSSSKVQVTSDGNVTLTGNLTMLGKTKSVELKGLLKGPKDVRGQSTLGLSVTGSIKRSDFGMTYGSPGIGDRVEMFLDLEFQAQ